MDSPLSEGAWIDRFVLELARQGAPMEPELLIYLGREVWPVLGELSPEGVARADWDPSPWVLPARRGEPSDASW